MAQPATEFNLEKYIMHHVQNSYEWHVPFLPPIHLPSWLSLHGLMIIITAVLLIFLFCFVYRKDQRVPMGITNALEAFVTFIRDEIALPYLGEEDGRKMTPLFCTFFFFILGMNLLGIIPLFSTATGNVNVTGALALITLSFMVIGAISKNGIGGFLKSFIPSGIPVAVLIILVPLEIIGVFIKAFALMIRLFANMLAGHIVIFSLVGLVGLLGFIALPSVLLALFILLLELFVAFLQAYIFTLLSAMFIGQTYHPEH